MNNVARLPTKISGKRNGVKQLKKSPDRTKLCALLMNTRNKKLRNTPRKG